MKNKLNICGTDVRKTDYILPAKILMSTSGVTNSEHLLTGRDIQACVSAPDFAVFSTQGAKRAAVLIDFGAEIFGGVQIVTRQGGTRRGVKAVVRLGESVTEAMTPLGIKGACNDHAIRDIKQVLPWNGSNSFGQTGFRFAFIEIIEPENFIEIAAVLGIAVYRDIPYLGNFSCSDDLLNQIYDTAAYTVHVNMQTLLWDGIKRDQLVWIGDMHPEILTIRTIFGANAIVDDSLRQVASTNPLPGWPCNITTYGLWFLRCLWDWYLYTGNLELVKELLWYWKPLLGQLLDLVHLEGHNALVEEELARGFFLDWPSCNHKEAEAGVYALFVLTLEDAVKLCEVVGEGELISRCKKKRTALLRKKIKSGEKKQVTAIAYLSGYLDNRAGAELQKGGGQGMSTFMSFYILTAACRSAGMTPALAMLREYYGGMLKVGATTFWEDFDLKWLREGASIERVLEDGEYDIHGDNGDHCYKGFRHSLCHGWSAGPAAFLAEEVLGVRILTPGCTEISIKPDLGDLTWAKGVYPTPFGPIHIFVQKENGKTVTKINAPKEILISQ